MNQKRLGIIITYLNLVVGMVINVFVTPFLITSFGDVDYSLYKVMQSFAGPLAMFHLGVSTVVARCIVKNSSPGAQAEKERSNILAHALLASAIMVVMVIGASVVMYLLIPSMYGHSYSEESISVGQKMFTLFAASSVLHMLTDAFSGCLIGHERFAVSSVLALCKTVGKLLLYVVFVICDFSIVSIVMADLLLSVGTFLFTLWYAMFVLRERPQMTAFDKGQMLEILSYGLAILLQAFVNQVNNNVDTMILGVYVDEKWIVTMYSSALAIYSIYNSLVSAISNFFLPDATKLVNREANGREITDFVIRRGRVQGMIAIACICGFSLFGRDFISLWIGERYLDAYGVILLLMIPVTIPLVENAMIAILDATLKRIVRSSMLVVMAVINIAVSIVLVQVMGFWGAAVGTAASLVIGHGLIMNMYYYLTFKIEICRMFLSIFKGVLPAGILAMVVSIPVLFFLPRTLICFVVEIVYFLVAYVLFLLMFGFNTDESEKFKNILRKVPLIGRCVR